MVDFLFALLLLQAIPNGVVTGVVRSADGKPASGVRVYAMVVKEGNGLGNGASVLESITQTDESGRYRLEIPAGRYYLAAGSLEAPTYFPGTPDVASARVISITSAAAVDAIDFAQFVPASSTPSFGFAPPPPGSSGVLSGVIRFPDGTAAAGITVSLAPANMLTATGGTAAARATVRRVSVTPGPGGALSVVVCASAGPAQPGSITPLTCSSSAQTDGSGRYRITNISPGTYYIVAGYGNSPVYYPGTPDDAAATSITTSPGTNLDTLDFTMPDPSKGTTTTVRGRVVAGNSTPVAGAIVELQGGPNVFQIGGFFILPSVPSRQTTSAADGSFEFADVLAGTRTVVARRLGASSISRRIVVTDQPVNGVDFVFP